MQGRKWKIPVLLGAGLVACAVLAFLFVPIVRYTLIPITGGTKAPETLQVAGANLPSRQGGAEENHAASPGGSGETGGTGHNKPQENGPVFVPGTLGDAQGVVQTIAEVPVEGGWINTGPLDLARLRAENRCILIDFWTYTCINCIRATPYTQELWDRYKDYGLVVIGVHSPEFEIERNPANILVAVRRMGITYPVETDGDMVIWRRFGNHFWPGKYLVDTQGDIVYTRFGEGGYEEEEQVVRKVLTAAGWRLPDYGPTGRFLVPDDRPVTPELYAGPGFLRRGYGNTNQPEESVSTQYSLPSTIEPDRIYLEGRWKGAHDYVASPSRGKIVLNYLANAVYIVLDEAHGPLTVEVRLDGGPLEQAYRGRDIRVEGARTVMVVDAPRLYYPIAGSVPYGRHTISFETPEGLHFYSFTFGAYSSPTS